MEVHNRILYARIVVDDGLFGLQFIDFFLLKYCVHFTGTNSKEMHVHTFERIYIENFATKQNYH